jgi:hypothetical protein
MEFLLNEVNKDYFLKYLSKEWEKDVFFFKFMQLVWNGERIQRLRRREYKSGVSLTISVNFEHWVIIEFDVSLQQLELLSTHSKVSSLVLLGSK